MIRGQKTVLVPFSMADAGLRMIEARDDIRVVRFDDEVAPERLHFGLRDADGVILGHTHFGAAEIAAARRLRVVGRIGVGFDSVDVEALTVRRIPLMVTDTENSVSVAEHTLAFMLALSKKMIEMDAMVRTGRWHERLERGHGDLFGKTVLIIGFGRIGARTASRCLAMEMRVLVHDRDGLQAAITASGCEPFDDLDAAIAEADFVCILCPKTEETINLFDARRIALMRKTAFLINAARGGMVDELALYHALASGRLGGAALDVFEQEPPVPRNPLLTLQNFIAAPHVAGLTCEAADRMAQATANNVLSVLDGCPNRDRVLNKSVLD